MSKNEKEENKVKRFVVGKSQKIFVIRRKSGIKLKEKKKEEVKPRVFSFSSLFNYTLEEDIRREKEDPEKVERIRPERKKR